MGERVFGFCLTLQSDTAACATHHHLRTFWLAQLMRYIVSENISAQIHQWHEAQCMSVLVCFVGILRDVRHVNWCLHFRYTRTETRCGSDYCELSAKLQKQKQKHGVFVVWRAAHLNSLQKLSLVCRLIGSVGLRHRFVVDCLLG